MKFLLVDHGRWPGSQIRPCMHDGGKHLNEMELNWLHVPSPLLECSGMPPANQQQGHPSHLVLPT